MGYAIWDVRSLKADIRYWMSDVRSVLADIRCWMLDVRSKKWDVGCEMWDMGKKAGIHFLALSVCILLLAGTSLMSAQRVRVGADVLLAKHLDLLAGKRVGIVCNQTSILSNGTHLVDTLLSRGVNVTALYAPEHGIRGQAGAGVTVENEVDKKTGCFIEHRQALGSRQGK